MSSRDKGGIHLHATFDGERAEGIYHPATGLLDIVSGPAPKATGLKPSPAAKEFIQAVKKAKGQTAFGYRTGSTNGWKFWVVTATGKRLESIRPKPAETRRGRRHDTDET